MTPRLFNTSGYTFANVADFLQTDNLYQGDCLRKTDEYKIETNDCYTVEFWIGGGPVLNAGYNGANMWTQLFSLQFDQKDAINISIYPIDESKIHIVDQTQGIDNIFQIDPGADFNNQVHHFEITISKSLMQLAINGGAKQTIKKFTTAPSSLICFIQEANNRNYRDYFFNLRIWRGDLFFDNKGLENIAFQSYSSFPVGVDWTKFQLFSMWTGTITICTNYGKGNIPISLLGEEPVFFPNNMFSPLIPQMEVQKSTSYSMGDISFIDFWVRPKRYDDGKFHSECLFEITDGTEIGNVFGVYIAESPKTTYQPNAALYFEFRSSRIEQTHESTSNSRSRGANQLQYLRDDKLSYITLCFSYDKEAGQYEMIFLANGQIGNIFFINNKTVFLQTVAFQHLNDINIEFISIKQNAEGKGQFAGDLIGPRFWKGINNRNNLVEELRNPKFHNKIAAYAYTDFFNFNKFGALARQEEFYGKLAGILIPDPTKKSNNFHLLGDLNFDLGFLAEGIEFEPNPAVQVFNKHYPASEVISKIDMGQREFPVPMKTYTKGHPVDLHLSEIGIIDFWICLKTTATGDVRQTVIQLTGVDAEYGSIAQLGLQYDTSDNLFYLIKTYNDIDNEFKIKQSAGLNNNKYHHFCFYLNNNKIPGNIELRINGAPPVINIGGPGYMKEFDFEIETIYAGSSYTGDNLFQGDLCGPRFWRGLPFDEITYQAIAFAHFTDEPQLIKFKYQEEIAKLSGPHILKSQFDQYTELFNDNLLIKTFEMPPLSSFQKYVEADSSADFKFKLNNLTNKRHSKSLPSDYLADFIGTWVQSDTEKAIPELIIFVSNKQIISREKHCFYQQAKYMQLILNPGTHVLHLITDSEDNLIMKHSSDGFAHFFKADGTEVCRMLMENRPVWQRNEFQENDSLENITVQYLFIFSKDEKIIPSGYYKRPYRKPRWGNADSFGNIFLNRPPNFDTVLMGYDITNFDPAQYFDYEGSTGNPIFRVPPITSALFDLHQGVAIPHGWNYIPFVSNYADTDSKITSNQTDIETNTTNTVSHKKSVDNKVSGTVGVPYVFGVKASLELGFDSSSNKETAQRTKDAIENQSMYSIQNWNCTSHDIVLDKPNVFFSGEFIDGDNAEEFDFNAGFYNAVHRLKHAAKADDDIYERFIAAYGTHYVASVRFGSKGWRIHRFDQKTIEHLATSKLKVGFTKGYKVGVEVGASGMIDGFAGSIEDQLKISGETGDTHEEENTAAFKNMVKNEKEESDCRGSYSNNGVDHIGEIHVYRYLEPIYELLRAPFFNDFMINTYVHDKLKSAINKYVNDYVDGIKKDYAIKSKSQLYYINIDLEIDYSIKNTIKEISDQCQQELVGEFFSSRSHHDDAQVEPTGSLTSYAFNGQILMDYGVEKKSYSISTSIDDDKVQMVCDQIRITDRITQFIDGKVEDAAPVTSINLLLTGTIAYSYQLEIFEKRPWYHKDYNFTRYKVGQFDVNIPMVVPVNLAKVNPLNVTVAPIGKLKIERKPFELLV